MLGGKRIKGAPGQKDGRVGGGKWNEGSFLDRQSGYFGFECSLGAPRTLS